MGSFGAALLAWLAYVKYVKHEGIADRPLLLFGIMFVVAGIQLLMHGLTAEMQARTYHESQGKPIYIIREVRETRVAANTGVERQVKTFGRRSGVVRAADGSRVERLVRELADVSCACRPCLAAGDRDKPSAGDRVDHRLGLAR